MDNPYKNRHILYLNHHKKDSSKMNDFADYNYKIVSSYFRNNSIFYFYEFIISNGLKKTECYIEELIKKNKISIIFYSPNGTNYELSIEFFKRMRDVLNVKAVLWVLDDELIFDTLTKYYAQAFNAVVTCDYYATFAYQKLGIPAFYYFSNYSKEDFYPISLDKDIDVSFIGDCTKNDRVEYIKYLKKNDISVETYGEGSENGFVAKEDMSKIFSRSKINLNFTKVNLISTNTWFLEDNNLTNIIRQNKGRPMELALTNSFCLSEYSSSLDITFEIGKDLDVFYNKEDLLLKVRAYLENETLRLDMANNAYKKAVTLYEVDIFMPKLLDKLCETIFSYNYPQRSSMIYKDNIFRIKHIQQLTIMMFYQLSKLKTMSAFETSFHLIQYGFIVFLISFFKGVKIVLSLSFLKLKRIKKDI
jgi:spore maturation protein CgeB